MANQLNPDWAKAYVRMAEAYFSLGRNDESAAAYLKA